MTRCVLAIDALDQFEATTQGRHLTWLPHALGANARLITTAVPGEANEALRCLTQRAGHNVLSLYADSSLHPAQRMELRAARLAKPIAETATFPWRFAFMGAAVAAAVVLTVLAWPRSPAGRVLASAAGLRSARTLA